MKKPSNAVVSLVVFLFTVGLGPSVLAQNATAVVPVASADASVAAPKKGSAHFFELHESFLQRAKAGPIGVLFLGDSSPKAGPRRRIFGIIILANISLRILALVATGRST